MTTTINDVLDRRASAERSGDARALDALLGDECVVVSFTIVTDPVRDRGGTWIVSPFGEVASVRDARVAGQVALERGAEHPTHDVRELGPDESRPVLRRYLSTPARFLPGRQARESSIPHPVFELTPVR